MIGKVIWLGLVWLLYPYAMVPYIYESIHPIKLQVIHLLKKDMSEPGTRDCSNAWWHLGDEYGGSPPKRLTFDTQQPIDARDRSRWWTDRCRLSYTSPPPTPTFVKVVHRHPGSTSTANSVATFSDWDPCHWRVVLSVVSSIREPALRWRRSEMTRNPVSHRWSNPGGWGIRKNWDPRI